MENNMSEIVDTFIDPVYHRLVNIGAKNQNEIYILLHGWLGNEKSMSIFSSVIPHSSTIVYPRGTTKLGNDQYGWVDINNSSSNFYDYAESSKILFKSIIELLKSFDLDNPKKKFNLIGFSQGAAMCAVLSLLYPDSFNKIAILAGFLPKNHPEELIENLEPIHYYIAHGKDDQLVSFDKSIELRDFLLMRNANVQFCEEDIGHKVGKNCLKNLKNFFAS